MAIQIPRRTLVQLEGILKGRVRRRDQVKLVVLLEKCKLVGTNNLEEGC
jgi:hypothetical protein